MLSYSNCVIKEQSACVKCALCDASFLLLLFRIIANKVCLRIYSLNTYVVHLNSNYTTPIYRLGSSRRLCFFIC